MAVSFMAACNDWRNGMPTGVFWHSEITRNGLGCIAELDHRTTTVSCDEKLLRVGRLRVPYLSYRQWVGNWCWDSWLVSEKAAAQIINYLMQKRGGQCIGGECEVGDLLDAKQIIVASNLRRERMARAGEKEK